MAGDLCYPIELLPLVVGSNAVISIDLVLVRRLS